MSAFEAKKQWLESLKAGDVVGRTGSISGAPVACTVDRVTATQIIIGQSRYAKATATATATAKATANHPSRLHTAGRKLAA